MKRRKGKDQNKGRRTREEVREERERSEDRKEWEGEETREGGGGERSRALMGEGRKLQWGGGVSPDVEGVAEAVTPSSAVP